MNNYFREEIFVTTKLYSIFELRPQTFRRLASTILSEGQRDPVAL